MEKKTPGRWYATGGGKVLASCSTQVHFLSRTPYPYLAVRKYVLCAFFLNVIFTYIIYVTVKFT